MAATRSRDLMSPEMTDDELERAHVAQRLIIESLDRSRAARIVLTSDAGEQPPVAVPPKALRLIAQVLGALSEGKAVAVIPAKRELSTVEAANFLNVSRPFVIKEIESGVLPHRMVGSHRRVALDDLMNYAKRMHEGQQSALQRLADNAAELRLDY